MSLPNSADTITAAYLDSLLGVYSGEPYQEVASFSVEPLEKGTSGAELYVVTINLASGSAPLRFVLKLAGGRDEVFFYRELASRLLIDTPRLLDARILNDGRTWLLMEEITDVKDGLAWDEADYKAVLSDMARLHAQFWGRANLLDDCSWLWRPDDPSLQALVAARKSDLDAISASWLPQALPEVFGAERLTLAMRVLEQPERLFGPLLATGTTLVHGDYWFHNVQITNTGRRVLVDWQDPKIWSGLWELAYFLNLLLPVSSHAYREKLPVDEELMISWYADALAEAGVVLSKSDFDLALLSARIWHPLQHWVRQNSSAATLGRLPDTSIRDKYPAAVRFLEATFARWEQGVHTFLSM
ncbi:MAG TPA: phosphotransferase [Chloroflexia bacterium]|nr:phosphotransferase [Chloroflexia bacterium]